MGLRERKGPWYAGRLLFYSETGTEGALWALQLDGFRYPHPAGPDGYYQSHHGLYVLNNWDQLRIYSKDGETIEWEDTVIIEEHHPFTEHAQGLWIRSDLAGVRSGQISRDKLIEWFLTDERKAEVQSMELDGFGSIEWRRAKFAKESGTAPTRERLWRCVPAEGRWTFIDPRTAYGSAAGFQCYYAKVKGEGRTTHDQSDCGWVYVTPSNE